MSAQGKVRFTPWWVMHLHRCFASRLNLAFLGKPCSSFGLLFGRRLLGCLLRIGLFRGSLRNVPTKGEVTLSSGGVVNFDGSSTFRVLGEVHLKII